MKWNTSHLLILAVCAPFLILSFQNCGQLASAPGSNNIVPGPNTVDPEPNDGQGGNNEPLPLTEQERVTAATETANTNPACGLGELPEGFYWEIGDRDGAKASGSVVGNNTPKPTQVITIASASKWIYSTYVLQKVGSVRDSDLPFLNFTSGYLSPPGADASCERGETVSQCAAKVSKNLTAIDKFFYNGGHFQYHAANIMGIGAMDQVQLTAEIISQLGAFDFVYLQTNLAGGVNASASSYTAFLRRMLLGEYVMSSNLGYKKVCASAACAAGFNLSPAPPDEAWNYSLGHWVEDDPVLGDGSFSSPGAIGFYPWIDATKTWYGVIARRAASTGGQEGVRSQRCGRLIRQAWVTGVTVTSTTPSPKK